MPIKNTFALPIKRRHNHANFIKAHFTVMHILPAIDCGSLNYDYTNRCCSRLYLSNNQTKNRFRCIWILSHELSMPPPTSHHIEPFLFAMEPHRECLRVFPAIFWLATLFRRLESLKIKNYSVTLYFVIDRLIKKNTVELSGYSIRNTFKIEASCSWNAITLLLQHHLQTWCKNLQNKPIFLWV